MRKKCAKKLKLNFIRNDLEILMGIFFLIKKYKNFQVILHKIY